MYGCGMFFLCLAVIYGRWFHILKCFKELRKKEYGFCWIKRVIIVSEGGREIEKICNDVNRDTVFSNHDICNITERF